MDGRFRARPDFGAESSALEEASRGKGIDVLCPADAYQPPRLKLEGRSSTQGGVWGAIGESRRCFARIVVLRFSR
jgi:hypothetical protein